MTTTFPSAGGSAHSRSPLPSFARLLLAGLLAILLSLFLTAPTWAQRTQTQRTPVKHNAASYHAGVAGTQTYTTGIGLRAGSPTALSIKHFYRSRTAFEGLVGTRFGSRGFYAGLLVEQHATAFQTRGLLWYYGLGGHVSSYRGRYFYDQYRHGNRTYYDYYGDHFWGVGVDAILGLEYQLPELPFTIGADLKPYVELVRSDGYFNVDGAFSVRYVF